MEKNSRIRSLLRAEGKQQMALALLSRVFEFGSVFSWAEAGSSHCDEHAPSAVCTSKAARQIYVKAAKPAADAGKAGGSNSAERGEASP